LHKVYLLDYSVNYTLTQSTCECWAERRQINGVIIALLHSAAVLNQAAGLIIKETCVRFPTGSGCA